VRTLRGKIVQSKVIVGLLARATGPGGQFGPNREERVVIKWGARKNSPPNGASNDPQNEEAVHEGKCSAKWVGRGSQKASCLGGEARVLT